MATTTTNLGLTKPALSESADVGVINDNSDKIDVEAGKSRANLAATYSASSAYAVGDYCERGGNLYRCTTAIGSGGEAWNSGHWTQVAVTDEIPKVIDNLTSTSASAALSAKQGKALNDKIKYKDYDFTMGSTAWNGVYYVNVDLTDDLTGGYTCISVTVDYFQNNRPVYVYKVVLTGATEACRIVSPVDASAAGYTGRVRAVFLKAQA